MAKISAEQLQRLGRAQQAEDDDLDIDVTKSRKLAKHHEEQEEKEETPEERRKDTIKLLITIGVVVTIIAAFAFLFVTKQPKKVLTIDELHQANTEGKLDPDEGYLYNGYSFIKFGDLWYSQLKKNNTIYDVTFNFDPKKVENITVEGQLTTDFVKDRHIYITFDPEGSYLKYIGVANYGLSRSLAWAFQYNMTAGCTKNVTRACQDAGIVTCEDSDKAVIYFKEDAETKITLDKTCVTIQGSGAEFIRAKDRLLLRWYGMME